MITTIVSIVIDKCGNLSAYYYPGSATSSLALWSGRGGI